MVKAIKRWLRARKSKRLWKMMEKKPLSTGPGLKLVFPHHGRGQVWYDGKKIPHVQAVTLSAGVEDANLATITVVPDTIEAEGAFDISTIESTARELIYNEPLTKPCE